MRQKIIETVRQNHKNSHLKNSMTVEDVRRISEMPQIAIGSHTVTHPFLPNCSNSQLDYELRESKRILEDWTGKPVWAFSYPNGDFDDRARQRVRENGYGLAATTENGFYRLNGDRYLLPRMEVMNDGSFTENLCHALGVWTLIISKFKRIMKF
jgi:peptidoglycan/xylan/chitin deacetylase (PgdA/CDA1 family)